jgi:hypothetical protein
MPDGVDQHGVMAENCLAHCDRRGYTVTMVAHDWDGALQALGAGLATVVVLARREHFDPTWKPRLEFVGQQTRDLHRPELRAPWGETGSGRRPHIIE